MQVYTCIYCYICIFMIKSLNRLTLCCCFNRRIITPIFRHYIYLMFWSNIYIYVPKFKVIYVRYWLPTAAIKEWAQLAMTQLE